MGSSFVCQGKKRKEMSRFVMENCGHAQLAKICGNKISSVVYNICMSPCICQFSHWNRSG